MANFLVNFDYSATEFLFKILPKEKFLVDFFSFFSLQGISIIIWLVITLILVFVEERKNPGISLNDKKLALSFGLNFFINTIVVEFILKNLFSRSRPIFILNLLDQEKNLNLLCPSTPSFPSTHTALAMGTFFILSHFFPKKRIVIFLVACLISYSRIYLGCHFLFDVLAGAVLGIFVGLGVLFFSDRLFTSPHYKT